MKVQCLPCQGRGDYIDRIGSLAFAATAGGVSRDEHEAAMRELARGVADLLRELETARGVVKRLLRGGAGVESNARAWLAAQGEGEADHAGT